jgi:DNA-binding transcriptional ArsR family regulator
MSEDVLNELKKLNRNVSAMLAITVDRHLRDTDLAKPRPRSIDRMLADLGLSGSEIAKLLGKTPQAVSIALSKDKQTTKSKKTDSKQSVTSNEEDKE